MNDFNTPKNIIIDSNKTHFTIQFLAKLLKKYLSKKLTINA